MDNIQKKYLILGNGWIGNILKNYIGRDARIYDKRFYWHNVYSFLPHDYDVLINTIAKTDIDWCEKNKNETFNTNVLLARDLAMYAKENKKQYVFFSSACIFESKNISDIKDEWSKPNPQCFYAETKALAEQLIKEIDENILIARLRLPISEVPHPRNTLNKLLKYSLINDTQESVTIVEDMMPELIGLIEINAKGIFHFINEGTISPAEIAELMGHTFTKVTKEEQDKRLMKENRAKRVTAYVDSTRMPMLPNIKRRITDVIKVYHGANTTS